MATTSDSRAALGSVIRNSDMKFHPPRYRDYRWLETNCYSFTIPELAIGGQMWTGFRTNVGVVASHVWVWSSPDPAAGYLHLDYDDHRTHIPMGPEQLDDFQLPNGLRSKMVKPREEWQIRYEGADDTVFDLHLRGLCPPLHISETATRDGELGTIRYGHLDQMMEVTGTVRVNGRDYAVDWPSWRDHSWSPRPEGAGSSGYAAGVSSNFDYGAFGNDYTFFVVTTNFWDSITKGVVHNGYIVDHGETLRLNSGEGRFVYDRNWATTALEYELEDERGRTHRFRGEPKSFHHSGTTVLAVVRWETPDGEVGWGQYDWHGNLRKMRELRPWE